MGTSAPPQPILIQGTPVNQNPNIIHIQPQTFKPSPNYRHYAYIAMAVGIVLTLIVSFLSYSLGLTNEIGTLLNNLSCCGFFGIAFALDIMFYNSRMKWEQSVGASTTNSTIGIVLDGFFLVCAILAVLGSFILALMGSL